MLTPEEIAALADAATDVTVPIEEYLIKDIARRIAGAGQLTSTAAYQIYRAQQLGLSRKQIRDMLRKELKVSHKELRGLLEQSAEVGYNFDIRHLSRAAVPFAENTAMQQMVAAAVKLAKRDFTNLTQTLGMIAPDGKAYPLQKAYQKTMDFAFQQVFTGASDYNTAIRSACKNIADMGVRVIDYESGVHTGLEAAVRRNIMGGLGLMQEQISQHNHDQFGADGWEISAHSGSAPDHEPIQGRQYSDKDYTRLNGSLQRRIGTLNCGHAALPIIMGVNEPQYSEGDLQRLANANAEGVSYQGRHYTGYEASQKQRQIERTIRKQKNRILTAEATGDKEQLTINQIRLGRLNEEYIRFSKGTGQRTQRERAFVAGFGKAQAARTGGAYRKTLQTDFEGGIINRKSGVNTMMSEAQTGIFAGALDPDSVEANLHSVKYYASVREMKNDAYTIAKNAGWNVEAVAKVKEHVFITKHDLGGLEPERFDADYNMAVSWQRLIEGKGIKPQDLTLLKHEYLELTLMKYKGLTYREAHDFANSKHNYLKLIKEEV